MSISKRKETANIPYRQIFRRIFSVFRERKGSYVRALYGPWDEVDGSGEGDYYQEGEEDVALRLSPHWRAKGRLIVWRGGV